MGKTINSFISLFLVTAALSSLLAGCVKKDGQAQKKQTEVTKIQENEITEKVADQEDASILRRSKLDEEVVRTVFRYVESEVADPSALDQIQLEEGSFSSKDAHEAVVSIWDRAQAHAFGSGEVWLLRYEREWVAVVRVENADFTGFNTIDVDNDGIMEIWVDAGTISTYQKTKKSGSDSGYAYEEVSSTSSTSTYRLKDGSYQKVEQEKSP